MIVAVISGSLARAKQLADDLGIEGADLFSARNVVTIDGLRVDRALIDADANIDDRAMQTIIGTTIKTTGGKVSFVTARRRAG